MKTIFFETSTEDQIKYKNLLASADVTFYEEKLTKENINLATEAEIISVFINSEIKKEIIDELPNLKYIVTRSTGYDHIDGAYAKEKNITVSNVPSYGSTTVAEFTFALILALSRNLYRGSQRIKEGGHFDIKNLRGFDLKGKTIGIAGTGRIGRNVVRIARGFEMNIIAYDPHPDEKYEKENNLKYVDFDTLVKESDILTLHMPYMKETHHIINKEKISKMKKGIYLINTARGELIETESLLWGISEKIIAGAGLDVLEGERILKEEIDVVKNTDHTTDYKTLLEDHILMNTPEVIVTPHIAFYSEEAESEIINTTVGNILSFEKGQIQNIIH